MYEVDIFTYPSNTAIYSPVVLTHPPVALIGTSFGRNCKKLAALKVELVKFAGSGIFD